MRLPNGFGSVYKLSGKRRKPWAARKTIGYKDFPEQKQSYPIYEFIGFYITKQEALTALVKYNADPYDLRSSSITFAEVYDRWSDQKFTEISDANIKGYKAAYALCKKLHNMKFIDIKLDNLQKVADESGKNAPTLKKWKTLLGQMYDYAIIHEMISKDRHLVQYINIKKAGNPNVALQISCEKISYKMQKNHRLNAS